MANIPAIGPTVGRFSLPCPLYASVYSITRTLNPNCYRIAGINQMINSACNIAGPALGALAITTLAMPVVLMLDVVGAILACTSLAFVKIPNPPPTEHSGKNNILQDLREAQREVTSHRGLPLLLILSITATFLSCP